MSAPVDQARALVAERLRDRQEEMERETMTRVLAVPGAPGPSDPEYACGLRAAVSAAVEHGLRALEQSEERPPDVPLILIVQARRAAREHVPLDTVLRRYIFGNTLINDFTIEEAQRCEALAPADLQRLLRAQAAVFDRLLAVVSEEYVREERSRVSSPERRNAERIERLLAGERFDPTGFAYEFAGQHLGLLASGMGAGHAFGELARRLGCRLLLVRRGESTFWAWLGATREVDTGDVREIVCGEWPAEIRVSAGEPAGGLRGWRLTHKQARAAFPVALREEDRFVQYRDVALLASMAEDDVLVTSLRELYLVPLSEERDGGAMVRSVLRAYFDSGRNVSSAAAALGVNRHTVSSRLRTVEERIGRPLAQCAPELEAALQLDRMADAKMATSA